MAVTSSSAFCCNVVPHWLSLERPGVHQQRVLATGGFCKIWYFGHDSLNVEKPGPLAEVFSVSSFIC